MPQLNKKVLVSDSLSKRGIELLEKEQGIDVDVNTGLSEDELIEVIGEYDALIIRSATKVTSRVLDAAKKLAVVGRAGIGLDNVDIKAATNNGVAVMNTPGGNVVTTAEHAFSLLLSLSRQIPQANMSMSSKKWEKKRFMGVEVFNKTLGIVGLGRVGSVVVRLAQAMRMKVVVYDPFISLQLAKRMEVEVVELDELLKKADFITVHTPLTKDTRHLFNESTFSKMKKGVRIVNCARGGIVDEEALLKAIDDGIVAGAALDVFENEPPAPDSAITKNPKIVCTPHLGASTVEAQDNVAIAVAEQIIDLLKTGTIRNAVNAPSVSEEILSEIGPYLKLAERLGKTIAQLSSMRLEELEITYSGNVLDKDISLITIAAIKGILENSMRDQVNYVNAPVVASRRNIQINEIKDNTSNDYTSMVTVTINPDSAEKANGKGFFSISGNLGRDQEARVVALNGFPIEIELSNNAIIISNKDVPGVIGSICGVLGEAGKNIASMNLGRDPGRNSAISIINVDQNVEDEVINKISRTKDVTYVKLVRV